MLLLTEGRPPVTPAFPGGSRKESWISALLLPPWEPLARPCTRLNPSLEKGADHHIYLLLLRKIDQAQANGDWGWGAVLLPGAFQAPPHCLFVPQLLPEPRVASEHEASPD